MKLKLDEEGHVVVQDGKPVYVHNDGKEAAFDAPGTVATITRLNGEAKSHRERAETAEKSLKAFEGIDDPEAAVNALKTITNLDAKKLVDAGEIEKVKAEAIKAVEDKYAPVVKERDSLQQALHDEKIGGSFARSKMIADKFIIPPDMVQARFGSAFKIEEGKVVAYDHSGNRIYSREKPGELAEFEEALDVLVGNYPYRENILKGSAASGGGAHGDNGSGGSKKTIQRSAFDSMKPHEQHAHISGGGEVTD